MSLERLDTPSVDWQAGDDIASIIARYGREIPNRIALVQGGRTTTWAEFDRQVDAVASALLASGVRPGDKVAFLAENSIEYAEAYFGALRAGACVVPLQTLASPEALAKMVADSGARALFVGAAYSDVGAAIAGENGALRVVFDGDAPGFVSYGAFLARSTGKPVAVPVGPNDAFDVIYSSGTTGVPKGIVHSHAARKSGYAGGRSQYFPAGTVNILATPFYSNTTCVTWFLTTAAGGTNVILAKFSAEAFLEAARDSASGSRKS